MSSMVLDGLLDLLVLGDHDRGLRADHALLHADELVERKRLVVG